MLMGDGILVNTYTPLLRTIMQPLFCRSQDSIELIFCMYVKRPLAVSHSPYEVHTRESGLSGKEFARFRAQVS